MSAAKALALATDLPYVGVNHLEAHLHAAWLEDPDLEPPLAVLIVSGGHTMTVVMEDHGRYRVLGQTVDDAAGEAFDKVARHLGLGYPGGPAIDRLARRGRPGRGAVPARRCAATADFSFSGLKTAVVNHVRTPARRRGAPTSPRRSRRRSSTSSSPSWWPRPTRPAPRPSCSAAGWPPTPGCGPGWRTPPPPPGGPVFLPPPSLCTDNGAMIAATAWWRLRADGPTPLDAGADPNLRLV